MTVNIELQPDDERALRERARASGRDLAGYIHQLLAGHLRSPKPGSEHAEEANGGTAPVRDLIDYEAIEACAREVKGKVVPSIEEVRDMLSKIPGSMAQMVVDEREDRF
jgi:hypothetical protein